MAAGDPGYAERKGNKTKPAKPADSVRIQRAENGYTVSCSHPPAETAGKDVCVQWTPDKQYVFETLKGATDFAAKAFGGEK